MEGVQTQLKERYIKYKWLSALCLDQDICDKYIKLALSSLNPAMILTLIPYGLLFCSRVERRGRRQQGRKAKEGREQAG